MLDRLIASDAWSVPGLLSSASVLSSAPKVAGLYRVRLDDGGECPVVYIGQTGRSLRERLRALCGAYADEMPYNDPHTAAPALWALRHSTGCDYLVQWHEFESDKRLRMGLESLAVSLERQRSGASPRFNFGGMPPGYRKSSGNTSKLVAAGRRFRGGPEAEAPVTPTSVEPATPLVGSPAAPDWLGLGWSEWTTKPTVLPDEGSGVYRLRVPGSEQLTYVGQGSVAHRLAAHAKKSASLDDDVRTLFASAVEVSWVLLPNLASRQLLEVENDLIASHVAVFDEPPTAQFLGT